MSIKKAVKELIELGLPIIPLCSHTHEFVSPKHKSMCPCAGKMPLIKGWQTRDITTEEDLVSWEEQFREYNIGLPLGSASGFCGIDVDGLLGEQALFEMSKGELPTTWEFKTGAGRRLLYMIPPGVKTKKVKQTKEGEHQECALMCDGQQTVIPPSIHINGTIYTWMSNKDPESIDCAEAPKWLLDLIRVPTSGAYQLGGVGGASRSASSALLVTAADPVSLNISDTEETPLTLALPAEISISTEKQKKEGKAKIAAMLNQPIQEGNRDDGMTKIIGHFCSKVSLRKEGLQAMLDRCRDYNLKWCDPPLEQEAIDIKVNTIWASEEVKTAQFQAKEKPDFVPKEWAHKVMAVLGEEGWIYAYCDVTKAWYRTKEDVGPWEDLGHYNGNLRLYKAIGDILEDPAHGGFPSWNSTGRVKEIAEYLRQEFVTWESGPKVGAFDMGAKENTHISDIIVFNNCVLNWRTMELIEWDPAYRTTVKFKVDYDPEATCPNFESYIQDWLGEDQLVMLVQEYLGTMLIPRYDTKSLLWLYGETNCGKTTLMRILENIFGDYCAHLTWSQIGERFSSYLLKGKLGNLYDDTEAGFKLSVDFIKNITSGGAVTAEQKGKDPVSFHSTAKPIFASNHLPKVSEKSDAFYGRLKLVHFAKQYPFDARVGMQINERVSAETVGIFNWLIKGLRRYYEQGTFTKSIKMDRCEQSYRSDNDTIQRFFNEFLEIRTEVMVDGRLRQPCIFKRDLHKVYEAWLEAEGGQNKTKGKKNFVKDLLYAAGPLAIEGRTSCETRTYIETGKDVGGAVVKNIWWKDAVQDDEDLMDIMKSLQLWKSVQPLLSRPPMPEMEDGEEI